MAEVTPTAPEPPQIAPFVQITMTDAGPMMKSNIQDGGQLVALLEQTKLFVLGKLFPPPAPLIQKVSGAVNLMLRR